MTDEQEPLADIGAADLVAALTRRGETVATAESLTAGLVSASIAGVPGASRVLRGGLVVYATDLKHSLAGVDADVLRRHGPVHPETARELAEGAIRICRADWGIALTGVAGPDSQDGHPPGTVFCAVARRSPRPDVRVHRLSLSGSRWDIRLLSSARAISELVAWIDDEDHSATAPASPVSGSGT